jgi:hypothetical protein
MGANSKRKPPHPALRRREMRKHLLVIVNASGSVDTRIMRPRFRRLSDSKAATHNRASGWARPRRHKQRRSRRHLRAAAAGVPR